MDHLKSNYIYTLIDRFALFFMPLILVPYTSRVLGSSNIGIYSYIYSIAAVFSTFGRLGLDTYGKLQIAKSRDDKVQQTQIIWELVSLRIVLTAIELVLYIAFIFWLNEYRLMCYIMIVYLLSDAFDVAWFYQGIEKFKMITVRSMVVRCVDFIMILAFVRGDEDLYKYVLILQGSTMLTNLVLWTWIFRNVSLPRFIINANTLTHLKHCFIYFIPTIGGLIYNTLDKTMLGYIGKSTMESGYYEQAYSIVRISQTFVLAFGTVTLPQLTYLYASAQMEKFKKIVNQTMRLSVLLLLPMSVGLYLDADIIVRTVLGEGFLGSIPVLKVLGILLFFASMDYNIGYQLLVSTEHQKLYNIGILSGAAANLVCNLLLISRYRAVGAAVGSLAAEVMIFICFVIFAKKIVSRKWIFPVSAWRYVIGCVIMSVWNLYFKGATASMNQVVQLLLVIGSSAIVYFGIVLILGEKDLIELIKLTPKQKKV